MSGIKCTKCGYVMDRTQAVTQIVAKTARDISKMNSAHASCGFNIDSVLAGGATECQIKCPQCNSVQGFVPANQ